MFILQHRWAVACLACVLCTTAPNPAHAGLFGLFKGRQKSCGVAYYQAPCTTCQPCQQVAVAPAPVAVAQTTMTQRCYLAPVTQMVQQTRVEPVTSYQTSYYLEPVTTMRVSTYYNPCTCNYENASCPVTSYVQRSVVTPVTSYVSRHYQVPVTRYEKRCVCEPVTTVQHYYPPVAAPAAAVAPVPAPVTTTAQYWVPVAPAPPPQPQQQHQPGNVIERNYQTPDNKDEGTLLIEREFQDGQIKKETKYYLSPTDPVPEAKPPQKETSMLPSAPRVPRLLRPVPMAHPRTQPSATAVASWRGLPVRQP